MPRIVARSPATIRGLLVRSASARLHIPPAINSGGQQCRTMCGLRPRGSRGEGDRDGHAGDRSPRPPGCGGGAEHRNEDNQRKKSPGQAERVDPVVETGLEGREDGEPDRETDDRPDHCADGADDGAVRQQHEAQMLRCCAGRGEHAELAESALRDDGEAGGGDERGEEQEDGGNREHRQRARPPAVSPAGGGPRPGGYAGLPAGTKAVDRLRCPRRPARVTVSGAPADAGETRANSSVRLTGVLDDADDGPAAAVERQRVPDLEPRRSATPSVTATCRGPSG